jgi:hypothetical protein
MRVFDGGKYGKGISGDIKRTVSVIHAQFVGSQFPPNRDMYV